VEELLLLAAIDPEPGVRAAAVSSLGWQEPIALEKVRTGLGRARKDADAGVRFAARAALARLGERASLDIFRKGLASEDPQQALLSIQAVAEENLTLLWPDVDARADAPDAIVAHHAREALALLSEEATRPHHG
jgi:HEAT repeat protein